MERGWRRLDGRRKDRILKFLLRTSLRLLSLNTVFVILRVISILRFALHDIMPVCLTIDLPWIFEANRDDDDDAKQESMDEQVACEQQLRSRGHQAQ